MKYSGKKLLLSILIPALAFTALTGSGFGLWVFNNDNTVTSTTIEPGTALENVVTSSSNFGVSIENDKLYVEQTYDYFYGFELKVTTTLATIDGVNAIGSDSGKIRLTYSYACAITQNSRGVSAKQNGLATYIASAGVDIGDREYSFADGDALPNSHVTTTINVKIGSKTQTETVYVYTVTQDAEYDAVKKTATAYLYPIFKWNQVVTDSAEFIEFTKQGYYTLFTFHVELGVADNS